MFEVLKEATSGLRWELKHWCIGTGASLGSIGITLTDIEQGTRTVSAVLGAAIVLVTLLSAIRKYRKGE